MYTIPCLLLILLEDLDTLAMSSSAYVYMSLLLACLYELEYMHRVYRKRMIHNAMSFRFSKNICTR